MRGQWAICFELIDISCLNQTSWTGEGFLALIAQCLLPLASTILLWRQCLLLTRMIIILKLFFEYYNVHSLDPDSQSHQQSLSAVKGRMCEAVATVWCCHDDGVCLLHLYDSTAALRGKSDPTNLIPKYPKVDSELYGWLLGLGSTLHPLVGLRRPWQTAWPSLITCVRPCLMSINSDHWHFNPLYNS